MARNRLSPSRRREDIRVLWAEHLAAARKSGETQVAYCRAQGLDPKYFTLWKGKLRAATVVSAPRIVPLVAAPTAEPPASAMPETGSVSPVVSLRLALGNGMSLSLEIAPGALPALVSELSRLRC